MTFQTLVLNIIGEIALLFFLSLGLGVATERIRIRLNRRKPRILVSQESISTGDRRTDSPCGIRVIDGVKVRKGDIVILSRQRLPSRNGMWVVSSGTWQRYHQLSPEEFGQWEIPTAGSKAGTLWTCALNFNWIQVDKGRRLLPFESEDFSPNCPAEAAAYLRRLGINQNQIRFDRRTCIASLVADRFLTRAQGDLLLAKPENLTTHITTAFGTVRFEGQTWAGQVVAYMNALRVTDESLVLTQEALEEGLRTPFIRQELVGFKKIKNPSEPPPPPPRRSRYERPPVI